jgi:hypothetical protein
LNREKKSKARAVLPEGTPTKITVPQGRIDLTAWSIVFAFPTHSTA